MRMLTIALLFVLNGTVLAQEENEVELQIGDTLYFSTCTGQAYQYMDLYVKTRFELDSISYDSLNGWEFYNRFFNKGDFDVKRMPCSYQDRYGIIKHMFAITDEMGEVHNIIIAMIRDGSSAAYIVEQAFEEELIFAPAKR